MCFVRSTRTKQLVIVGLASSKSERVRASERERETVTAGLALQEQDPAVSILFSRRRRRRTSVPTPANNNSQPDSIWRSFFYLAIHDPWHPQRSAIGIGIAAIDSAATRFPYSVFAPAGVVALMDTVARRVASRPTDTSFLEGRRSAREFLGVRIRRSYRAWRETPCVSWRGGVHGEKKLLQQCCCLRSSLQTMPTSHRSQPRYSAHQKRHFSTSQRSVRMACAVRRVNTWGL